MAIGQSQTAVLQVLGENGARHSAVVVVILAMQAASKRQPTNGHISRWHNMAHKLVKDAKR
jgi:hypothetical protein